MLKAKKIKKEDTSNALDSKDTTIKSVQTEKKSKKPSKEIFLKQWLVTGIDEDGNRFSVFLLATCGLKAREAVKEKYENCDIWSVSQSAESEKTADWLKTHSPFYS